MSQSPPGVFSRKRVIDAPAIDALGHVNNVVWLDFIIQLADANISSLGWSLERAREAGGIWIVRRHEVDYHASALLGDEVLEETWVDSLRGARSLRRSRFTRIHDQTLLVSALTQWAFCDPDTLRPKRIPRAMIEAYEHSRAS